MPNWIKWTLSLLIGLVLTSLGILFALWLGTIYMDLAFKLGGGQ